MLDTPQYRGKVKLTGLGTPNSLRKYVKDGTIKEFYLWNPANLGYLAGYAAVNLASRRDHQHEGPELQGRQARQVQGRPEADGSARPAVRVQQGDHRLRGCHF